MATTNVALQKPTTANSSINPYGPNGAVDGNITTPSSRWLTNKLPGWLQVNLGSRFYVSRWVVRHLSSVGWAASYCLPSYSLQLSQDGTNWITVDSVAGNTASFTDRNFAAAYAVFARVVVNSAMSVNTALASLLEFELYTSPTTPNTLASLVFSSGALVPPFASTVASYTQQVGFDTSTLTVTATPDDAQATVAVNGQPSAPVALNVGSNTVTVAVTPVTGPVNNYVTTVTRADSAYLSALTMQSGSTGIALAPSFAKATPSYTASVGYDVSTVTFTPTAESSSATIKINGVAVTSGQASSPFPLTEGNNTFSVEVKATGGLSFTYSISVARACNLLLEKVVLTVVGRGAGGPYTVAMDSSNLNYSITVPGGATATTVTPYALSSNAIIKVNNVAVASGSASQSISLSTTPVVVQITTSSPFDTSSRSYALTISK